MNYIATPFLDIDNERTKLSPTNDYKGKVTPWMESPVEDMQEKIELTHGGEATQQEIDSVTYALNILRKANLLAYEQLIEKAKNSSNQIKEAKEILQGFSFADENGDLHPTVRSIILHVVDINTINAPIIGLESNTTARASEIADNFASK